MSQSDRPADPGPDLSIATDKVCFIVVKAREFDAKDLVTEPDPGSNPTDDRMIAILEDHKDDLVYREVAAFIGALSEDEQIDLVALAWLGRGDGTIEDWPEPRGRGWLHPPHGRWSPAIFSLPQPHLRETDSG